MIVIQTPLPAFCSDKRLALTCLARVVGITERAARKIMEDLEVDGYIEPNVGRLNRYRINTDLPFWREGERGVTVGELLELLWRDRD